MNNLKNYADKGKKTPPNPQIQTHHYTTPTHKHRNVRKPTNKALSYFL